MKHLIVSACSCPASPTASTVLCPHCHSCGFQHDVWQSNAFVEAMEQKLKADLDESGCLPRGPCPERARIHGVVFEELIERSLYLMPFVLECLRAAMYMGIAAMLRRQMCGLVTRIWAFILLFRCRMGPFRDQLARIRFEYDAATCHYEREVTATPRIKAKLATRQQLHERQVTALLAKHKPVIEQWDVRASSAIAHARPCGIDCCHS